MSALLHDGAAEVDAYRDMLGQLWLYVDWRYVTKQLETEHKERWAQAVEAWGRELNPDEPDLVHVDRWWLCPTCGVSTRAKRDDGPHEHCEWAHDVGGSLGTSSRGRQREGAGYKPYLVRMLREKADHWHEMASRHHADRAAAATALAYRNAYNDAASLIEFGEVAW